MNVHPEVFFWIIVGIGVGVTAFPLLYAIFTPSWWRGEIGRAQMLRALSMAALVDLAIAVRLIGLEVSDMVKLLVYGGIFIAEWYLLWTYLHERFAWPSALLGRLRRRTTP